MIIDHRAMRHVGIRPCDGCNRPISANKRKCLTCVSAEIRAKEAAHGVFMTQEEVKRRLKHG